MPGFNQTGPAGQGPMTGRRMGRCTNNDAEKTNKAEEQNQTPENLPENYGRGFGRKTRGRGHRGRGLGMQNRFSGV